MIYIYIMRWFTYCIQKCHETSIYIYIYSLGAQSSTDMSSYEETTPSSHQETITNTEIDTPVDLFMLIPVFLHSFIPFLPSFFHSFLFSFMQHIDELISQQRSEWVISCLHQEITNIHELFLNGSSLRFPILWKFRPLASLGSTRQEVRSLQRWISFVFLLGLLNALTVQTKEMGSDAASVPVRLLFLVYREYLWVKELGLGGFFEWAGQMKQPQARSRAFHLAFVVSSIQHIPSCLLPGSVFVVWAAGYDLKCASTLRCLGSFDSDVCMMFASFWVVFESTFWSWGTLYAGGLKLGAVEAALLEMSGTWRPKHRKKWMEKMNRE